MLYTPSPALLPSPFTLTPRVAQGIDGGIFSFLSTPALALNVMTQDATFQLHGQTVHGSFMTAAHVVARTAKGRNFTLSLLADRVLEMKGYNAHTAYANGTCSGTGDFDLYYRGEVWTL